MTVQYNLKNPEGLKQGDILIFDGKKMDVITKEQIVADMQKQINQLKIELDNLKLKHNSIKDQVNKRQKRFLGAFIKGVK